VLQHILDPDCCARRAGMDARLAPVEDVLLEAALQRP